MNSNQENQKNSPIAFKREMGVKKSVMIMDKVAGRVISIGGMLVIFAVLGILVFLVQQTLPLFKKASMTEAFHYTNVSSTKAVLATGTDEYQTIVFSLSDKGEILLLHAESGTLIPFPSLDLEGKRVTAFSMTNNQKHLIFGFSDGSVLMGQIDFPVEILPEKNLPEGLKALNARDSFDGSAIYSKIPDEQYRKIRFTITLEKFISVSDENRAITALDYQVVGEAEREKRSFVTADAHNTVILNTIQTKSNLLTGEKRVVVDKVSLPDLSETVTIRSVLLAEQADMIFIADKQGKIFRYNVQDISHPFLAEGTQILSKGDQITLIDFLIGSQSVVVGSQKGLLDIYFLSHAPERGTQDEFALIKARSFAPFDDAPTHFSPSMRNKSFAIGLKNNTVHVLHGTSQKKIARFIPPGFKGLSAIALSPRVDGLIAIDQKGALSLFTFSVPHPETTFRTLFKKVWYEGYPEATYTWQSSAGTDDYEPKLSLIPLIFGSLKAALHSLLLAVPIAILGAIYTSEFVDTKIKGIIKPAMEMMASLPSVVLGFVAALVLAPIVESFIFAVLLSFALIPTLLILAALLWQLLPIHIAFRLGGTIKLMMMSLFVVTGVFFALKFAPLMETLLFKGQFKNWLNQNEGDGFPFLFLILIPVLFLILSVLFSRYGMLAYRRFLGRFTPFTGALMDGLKWLIMAGLCVLSAYGTARLLTYLGADPRNSFVGTYVQRNTLIVGFAMGFAVIPIIYTIAEDALSAVPSHLRAASLGCGATHWQTALYVVLPTAASGVFSAIMVGMGRAVGETMIVVMAAGNTPLMDWNIFNGLRSLAATIAVELPEAVKGGTLYRVLFLSALVLFAITFMINTIAEIVRIRFRKRAMQL